MALPTPFCASAGQGQGRAEKQVICRICLEDVVQDIIAPCMCSGSSKWVHRHCLDRWRTSTVNPRSFTNCSECGFAYRFVLQRSQENADHVQRRRQIVGRLAGNFVLKFIILQSWLVSLAVIIHLLDSEEKLVDFFGLNTPMLPHDSLLDELRAYKATYYVASLLLSLIMLGVFGSIAGLVMCSRNPARSPVFGPGPGCLNCPIVVDSDPCCCRGCERCGWECGEGGAILGILAVVFLVLGVFFALFFLVAALQKAVSTIVQLREIRQLAGEYIVQDLSPYAVPSCPAPLPEDPMAAASAPPLEPSWAPVTDPITQLRLTRDMQAIYGLTQGS